jgi:deazaflavin-dependent oxidoreductase (nitroreductase family)
MATHLRGRVPAVVPIFNPLAMRLLAVGVPLGPNALLTVRGRKSGSLRTTPVAVVALDGRRWIIGTFGEVNWVRNLRAAGEGVITMGKQRLHVQATELGKAEAATFFEQVVRPYVRRLRVGGLLVKLLHAGDILTDPQGAAEKRPVFELR